MLCDKYIYKHTAVSLFTFDKLGFCLFFASPAIAAQQSLFSSKKLKSLGNKRAQWIYKKPLENCFYCFNVFMSRINKKNKIVCFN